MMNTVSPEPVSVIQSEDAKVIENYSLVLSAIGIHHHISSDNRFWIIYVNPLDEQRASYELARYDDENRYWPPVPPKDQAFIPVFRAQSLLLIGILMLFYAFTGPWSENSIWFAAGASDSGAILYDGQYYRLITSLTLHADLVHLLGNCFLGGILLHFYFHIVGNGLGLISLLSCATLANLLNVMGHGPGHLSVGFSTAVFSVVGILSALNFRRYRFRRPGQLILPLMAGVGLLAMLGTGGERTDLGAHFYGLLSGMGVGYVLGSAVLLALRERFTLQLSLTVIGLAIPLLAWHQALS